MKPCGFCFSESTPFSKNPICEMKKREIEGVQVSDVVVARYDAWQGLYINGQLVLEDDVISKDRLMQHVENTFVGKYEDPEVHYRWFESVNKRFPTDIEDVVWMDQEWKPVRKITMNMNQNFMIAARHIIDALEHGNQEFHVELKGVDGQGYEKAKKVVETVIFQDENRDMFLGFV